MLVLRGLTFLYKPVDIQMAIPAQIAGQVRGPGQRRLNDYFYRVEFRCGWQNCGLPFVLFVHPPESFRQHRGTESQGCVTASDLRGWSFISSRLRSSNQREGSIFSALIQVWLDTRSLHRNVRNPGRVDCCLYIVGSNNVSAFEDNGGFGGYGPVDSLVEYCILAIASWRGPINDFRETPATRG